MRLSPSRAAAPLGPAMTPPTEIYTLSLHDSLPISLIAVTLGAGVAMRGERRFGGFAIAAGAFGFTDRKSTRLNFSH